MINFERRFIMSEFYLRDLLEEFRKLPAETEWVEFKEAKNDFHFDDIGKYFSAISNEANLKGQQYGWLIFGIHDKTRKILGSRYREDRAKLDSLKQEIARQTTSNLTFIEIHELFYTEGRVVMFQIPAAPKGVPVAWKGHYYGRNGESLVPLNIQEIEFIRSQASNEDWSVQICDGATLEDLDSEALLKARYEYKKKNPKFAEEVDDWDDITFLNKAKVTIQGKITRTAIILLGKPESEHFLSPSIAK